MLLLILQQKVLTLLAYLTVSNILVTDIFFHALFHFFSFFYLLDIFLFLLLRVKDVLSQLLQVTLHLLDLVRWSWQYSAIRGSEFERATCFQALTQHCHRFA